MSTGTPSDRRQRRHRDSADEVVAVAVGLMAETGAAGLSLGEVARRMGMRTPSLYEYFPSKAALCDEIFARGWREAAEVLAPYEEQLGSGPDAQTLLAEGTAAFVTWALEHPGYAQLMFWRPVPHWEPSQAAYDPAIQLLEQTTRTLTVLQRQGSLRADADLDEATRLWTVLVAGVISQHLSNEPDASASDGRFTALVPPLIELFLTRYGATRRRRP